MNSLVAQVVDAVKAAVAAPPRLQKAQGDLALAEAALAPAKAAEAAARGKHDEQAFELLSRNDGGAALARSRASLDEAAGRVENVESAIRAAQKHLADAADAADAEALADGWDIAGAHGRRAEAAMERFQKSQDHALAQLPGVRESLEDFYAALPQKPDTRPAFCTKNGLGDEIDLYIYGHSDGWLGQSGMNAHVASLRPGLAQQAQDIVHRLLAADPRRGSAS